ncbi:MAG: START-like domain-containing protein [Bacteroides sp.]|nr:START-like domain-containing protein [Bacteroides sp.]
MYKKINLEYGFSSSLKILFSRISTSAGLSEWFADDVQREGNIFIFYWGKTVQKAELIKIKKMEYVRFRWLSSSSSEEYFEFAINEEPITNEVALLITDFVEEDEVAEAEEIWNKQIDTLHSILGA